MGITDSTVTTQSDLFRTFAVMNDRSLTLVGTHFVSLLAAAATVLLNVSLDT